MLRQLWRLSRTFEADGVRMSAPAIYAEYRGTGWRLEGARETGYEGVACVDDAARLAVLLLRAYEEHGLRWALEWAELNLQFVLHLQQPDGNFVNFILDWRGTPNVDGPTSRPGPTPWLARALLALATAHRVTGNPMYRDRYEAALGSVRLEEIDHADVLAVVVMSALEMYRASPEPSWADVVERACSGILALEHDGVLLNHPSEMRPHLWGFLQPAALCDAARALGRPEWVEPAREASRQLLEPAVLRAFKQPRTLPFEVSCTIRDLDGLHAATGDRRYGELAAQARLWFHGRNAAGEPMYDSGRGMVFDGIDGTSINRNSGAESNIEGALALFDELPWHGYRLS
jgi:uncharacterized protein YyaL (SSP411 family)